MAYAVSDLLKVSQIEYGDLIKYPKLQETCTASMDNELGCLSQGVGDWIPIGLETVQFISKDKVPKENLQLVQELCARYTLKKWRSVARDWQWGVN